MLPRCQGVLLSEKLLPPGKQVSHSPSQTLPHMFQFDWADAATGTCSGYAASSRETGTGGRIRGHFADKLTDKDGTGLPPQGRTVRAGTALPPGGARLLFLRSFPAPRDECRCCGCCGSVPAVPVAFVAPVPEYAHLMPRSARLNPGQETAARAVPCRRDREFVLVLARTGTDWDNRGRKRSRSRE
jgi:hypothetical protein